MAIPQFVTDVYYRLPAVGRNFIASRYGARSYRQRYGGSFARHHAEYTERDRWPRQRMIEWQNRELRKLLSRAVQHVPYYRDLHKQGKFPIEEVTTVEELGRLPILEKDVVRRSAQDFVAEDAPKLHPLHTSGTTGTPVRLFRSTETIRRWNGCFETRVRNWAGVRLGQPFAVLGGQLVVPVRCRRPPFWVWNRPGRQLYMSVYHLAPQYLDSYLDTLVKRQIEYLYGYASALDALATHALERGRRDIKVKVAISNAEPLLEYQRERIRLAFACEVRDTYAPTELTIGAFECSQGRMHLSLDMAVTELLDRDGHSCPAGAIGEVVSTGLINPDQPLIRYRQGDRAAIAPEASCSCGVDSPTLLTIDGRCDDVVITTDGRKIGRLDPVFKGDLAIREAQIVQHARDAIEVRVVPAPDFGQADIESIVSRMRDRVGDMQVTVVRVDELERTANGKLRAVVNLVDFATR